MTYYKMRLSAPNDVVLSEGGKDMRSKILQHITSESFLAFGLDQIVYIKPVTVADALVYKVHAADGAAMMSHDSFGDAVRAAHQRDLLPVTLQ